MTLIEKIPDFLIRWGIRRNCSSRLSLCTKGGTSKQEQRKRRWIKSLYQAPIAIECDKANEQHYEVPAEFFTKALGPNLKYSSAYWDEETKTLEQAEMRMLDLSCERAKLKNGQRVLELGCGWGSLTLHMGAKYPKSRITAISNSSSQREFIMNEAKKRGISNIEVITQDMNTFNLKENFDRVVSVEMFEHMRNWPELLKRISTCLDPDGLMFLHIFTHKSFSYPYEVKNNSDWMAKYFFSGGQMPSSDQLYYMSEYMRVDEYWEVNGAHYGKTSEHWLKNMDDKKEEIMNCFKDVYKSEAKLWFQYWRIFFMACEELFNYREGKEWFVSHYTLKPVNVNSLPKSRAS